MRILVVDDEPLHRRNFAAMLRKIDASNQLIEVGDGVQALDVMTSTEVDLVITDIRMPNMDGLQLLAEIRARYPRTRVIILSVYSEFAYAKQALHDGAVDYVLKPVMPKEVRAALDKVSRLMEEEKNRENKMNEALPFYREHVLNRALTAAGPAERQAMEELFGEVKGGVVLLSAPPAKVEPGPSYAENVAAALDDIFAGELAAVFHLEGRPGWVVALLAVKAAPAPDRFDGLHDQLLAVCGEAVQIAVGSWRRDLPGEVQDSYRDACLAMQFHFYELGRAVCHSALDYEDRQPARDDTEAENLICESLAAGDTAAAEARLDNLFAPLLAARPPLHPDVLRQGYAYTLQSILRRFENIFPEELRGALVYQINTMQAACPTAGLLAEQGKQVLGKITEGIMAQRQAVGSDRMENIRCFIDNSYMEDLTLESVAERFFFNRSYFSTLFKSHTGQSFSDYLTGVRMDAAKLLLARPENKVRDIAERVGYRDASYFARAFKRKTGFSPEEYRRMCTRG